MENRYLTVTALTRYIKHKIETDRNLKEVYLRGEISNFKLHSRGHMYLTLKDDQARIQAVMFSSYNRFIKFRPENGMNVLIKGEISVYEPHGQYQLYIHDMQPDGIGALYLAYEQLKEKLEKEGLFNQERKKVIPKYPEHIGVITSPTGAAVRDIFSTLNRRYPIAKKTLLPVLVQGEYAPQSIVQAINRANELQLFDCLIVGRGGGSIEELWSFNEESVARAIANSSIPIISAVGHETDFTISDFVADLRAPTPTGAAELAVPSVQDVADRISIMKARIQRATTMKLTSLREKLTSLEESYAFRYPVQMLRQKELDLDRLLDQLQRTIKSYQRQQMDNVTNITKRLMQHHPSRKIETVTIQATNVRERLQRAMKLQLQNKHSIFSHRLDKLSLLNPLDIIKRGYTVTYDENKNVVKSVRDVQIGENVDVTLLDGTLMCEVRAIKEEEK
ncbi:exodeoxyribonuclease VII large subunit [Salirhabdus sp. Marseille-P4669]|uniref:exodeoxyribonuclease VII large subunit n=1 Tax=Salirhabdus sp. Marseille-P4669 TaxID=2042310 RepID=UPI000C7A4C1F|nr:exodeoxyribonuclease VII large subunit [Salirhabdus sp. Marseille-P4669]